MLKYQSLNRLIGANAYWQVNKYLARLYGLDVAILIADLVAKGAYFEEKQELDEEGYFFNTRESIEEDTTLSAHKQRKAIKILVDAGLLLTKEVGLPKKTYYKVVNDKLLKILTTGGEKIQPLEVKKININKNKENKNKVIKKETKVSLAKAEVVASDSVVEVEVEEYGNADLNEIFAYWGETTGQEILANQKKNRYACYNLLRRHGAENLKKLIRGVAQANGTPYAPNIFDFCSLQHQQDKLIHWGRKQMEEHKIINLDDIEI